MAPVHEFFARLTRIFNSDQARAVVLYGNVYDMFADGTDYVPLIPLLTAKLAAPRVIRVVYELNGPVRIVDDRDAVKRAWITWRTGQDPDTLLSKELRKPGPSEAERRSAEFEQLLLETAGNPTLALEMLRQLTLCARTVKLPGDLVILVEAADMMLPAGGEIATLNDKQLQRISIVQDWFGDPGFLAGRNSVCLIAESRSLIHPRIARLPQVLPVEITPPDKAARLAYIEHFLAQAKTPPKLWSTAEDLAVYTAGLSIHALRQLLAGAAYAGEAIGPADVIGKVEEFIQGQLGDDVIEFKKPAHTLEAVVGFTKLKKFLREELIPRFRAPADKALTGAAVAGPIGGGKTFIFEAVAAELGLPVLVLKNIRSQWYGQTDVIFERLRRTLEALEKVVIFVDEADTQFGGVGQEEHSTERRLTGKIQAMMSDPRLRGRVVWLLMTARIHLLSPDIRRPGRVGDLIIPVLDPEGEDRREFVTWVAKGAMAEPPPDLIERLDKLTEGYSAAAYASLRQQLKAAEPKTADEVAAIVADQIPADIQSTRRYQMLQALVNCTRRSLLPKPDVSEEEREAWAAELRALEARGVGR